MYSFFLCVFDGGMDAFRIRYNQPLTFEMKQLQFLLIEAYISVATIRTRKNINLFGQLQANSKVWICMSLSQRVLGSFYIEAAGFQFRSTLSQF